MPHYTKDDEKINKLVIRLKNELIPYCQASGIKICDIRTYDRSLDRDKMYPLALAARKNKQFLPSELVAELEEYGIRWEIDVKGSIHDHILELVKWCKENNCSICDVPNKINGEINPNYAFIARLKNIKSSLAKEDIDLLDQNGMFWGKTNYAMRDRIYNELIPWCEENNKLICDIPKSIDGKPNPLSMFVVRLKNKSAELKDEDKILLIKYGMNFEVVKSEKKLMKEKIDGFTKLKNRFNARATAQIDSRIITMMIGNNKTSSTHLISIKDVENANPDKVSVESIIKSITSWCDQNIKYIYDIIPENEELNYLYQCVNFIRDNKALLSDELIEELRDYGMDWLDGRPVLTERMKEINILINNLEIWSKNRRKPLHYFTQERVRSRYKTVNNIIRMMNRIKGELTPEQISRLDKIGMVWSDNTITKQA